MLGKEMMMIKIKINNYKVITGPKTPPTNKNRNQPIGENQFHRKRDHKEAKVGNRVISKKGKCQLETIETREDRALKTVVVDLKEAADEVVSIMIDLIVLMIGMIGINHGEEEAEITSKIGENSMTEEISEIVETSEEEETVENIKEEEITTLKGEEVFRTEEISMIVEISKIRGIIMIKEIIKINATIMKKEISQKKENIKTKENIKIKGNFKIKRSIKTKGNIKTKENIKIKENIMIREISKKEIRGIMIINVQMMTINHPTNKDKMEREDFPSEILKMTHHKEITNSKIKGGEEISQESEIKVMDIKMITEDGHQ